MNGAKRALRSDVKAQIDEFPQSYIDESDRVITEKFLACGEYKNADRVFAYYSIGREVDTREIILSALNDGKRVALPVSLAGSKMIFREVHDLDHMKPGIYGIPEPDFTCGHMEPRDGDLVIVPALACDAEGNRLGRGAGYYDRFLDSFDCMSICLIRSKLMEYEIPIDDNDRKVRKVICEK